MHPRLEFGNRWLVATGVAGAMFVLAGNAAAQVEARFDYGCEPRSSSCAELTCTFDASASTSTEGDVTGFRWYFRRYLAEDRESEYWTRTGVRVTHTYTNTRCRSYTYFATLEVTDWLGHTNTHTEQVDPSRRADFPPENQKPIADFTATCSDLDCVFDASGSYDSDGVIASYSWSFGDGSTGGGATAFHSYGAAGSFTVYLTVADDEGATAVRGKTVSVTAQPPPGFTLTATGRTARGGFHVADLRWTGATASHVNVYRNNALVAVTSNSGTYADNTGQRGRGTYTYRLCEGDAGTSVCSNDVTVVFD